MSIEEMKEYFKEELNEEKQKMLMNKENNYSYLWMITNDIGIFSDEEKADKEKPVNRWTDYMSGIAERMAITIRVANLYKGEYENKRECPFYSEWKGMELMLKAMGINFEYDFDDNYEVSAVIVNGEKVII